MKREILFRGKRVDTGEWVEGDLISNNVIVGGIIELNEEYFNTEFWCVVDPETVGQFTGLFDKKGRKIFDGDVLSTPNPPIENLIHIVEWSDRLNGWFAKNIDNLNSNYGHGSIQLWVYNKSTQKDYEVIGNIYDNLELKMEELLDCSFKIKSQDGRTIAEHSVMARVK